MQIAGSNGGTDVVFSPLKGYLAEVLVMKGTNGTVLERTQLGAYLMDKYGLPL